MNEDGFVKRVYKDRMEADSVGGGTREMDH